MTTPFSSSYKLEKLAPAAPSNNPCRFDDFQFDGYHNRKHPVHAEVDGAGEWTSNRISFDDYSRMNTQTRKQSGARRLATPEWALDQTKLRALIVRLFEVRAFGTGMWRRKDLGVGTEQERLQRAMAKMAADKPKKLTVLDGLCVEYVTLKRDGGDPARERKLESLIAGLDTSIRLIDEGPGLIIRLVQLYYSVRLDSVGVSTELGIRPPHVRQTLLRMHRCWDEMQKTRLLQLEQARVDAERKEYRRKYNREYIARYRARHGVTRASAGA